jgi:hypothetical protein
MEYDSHCLAFYWSQMEYILTVWHSIGHKWSMILIVWHSIGHKWSILSLFGILLVTNRVYSHCLAFYWSQMEYDSQCLTFYWSQMEYDSHCLAFYWSQIEYIRNVWHSIGHKWSIFSLSDILLVTNGV